MYLNPNELRAMRKGLQLTQQQLADAIGVSRALVNHMEAGRAPITLTTSLAVRFVVNHPEARPSIIVHKG